jgi:hypothetical protein
MEPLSLVPSELSNLFTKVSMLLGSSTYSMFYVALRLRLHLPLKEYTIVLSFYTSLKNEFPVIYLLIVRVF